MKVADLYAELGIKFDPAATKAAEAAIARVTKEIHDAEVAAEVLKIKTAKGLIAPPPPGPNPMDVIGLGAQEATPKVSALSAGLERIRGGLGGLARVAKITGLALGASGLFATVAGLRFNANMEESRNQIAGMLALAKKTDLNDQLGTTDQLLGSLQKRAKKLPGSLADYTKVLGMIAQPLVSAGIATQDLEDITVGTAVAAKAMNVDLEAGARDINQAVMGQFHSVDQLTGRILGSLGYIGEEGRKRFNALSKERRAQVLKEALTQRQIAQMSDAQAASANGRLDTLKATFIEVLGKIAAPLFRKLNALMGDAVTWIDQNDAAIDAFAATVSGVVAVAFDAVAIAVGALVATFGFLADHQDAVLATLIAIGAIIAAAVLPGMIATAAAMTATAAATLVALAPVIAIGIAIAAVAYGVIKLVRNWGAVRQVVIRVWESIKASARGVLHSIYNGVSAIGDVFVTAGDVALAAWRAVIDWIQGKIDTVTRTIGKVVGFAASVGDFVTGGGSNVFDLAQATVSTTGPAANNGGRSIAVYNTINASGLTADQAAAVVDQKLQATYRDGLADLTGGRP